uniref:Uncharacterized protein n=1 Tax=Lotharella globosa TaxID=91324 RepID=A0A7S3Z5I6_9EUKA
MATTSKLVLTLAALGFFANAKDPLRHLADKIQDATATPEESSAPVEASASVETLGYHGKCDLRYYGEKGVGPLHTHIFQHDLHLDQDPHAFDAQVSLKNHGDKKANLVKVQFYASLDKHFGPHDRANGFLGQVAGEVDAHELKQFKYTNAHAGWGEGVRYVIAAWKSEARQSQVLRQPRQEECTHGYTWVVIGKVNIKKQLKCQLKVHGEKGVALPHTHDYKYDIHLDAHPLNMTSTSMLTRTTSTRSSPCSTTETRKLNMSKSSFTPASTRTLALTTWLTASWERCLDTSNQAILTSSSKAPWQTGAMGCGTSLLCGSRIASMAKPGLSSVRWRRKSS